MSQQHAFSLYSQDIFKSSLESANASLPLSFLSIFTPLRCDFTQRLMPAVPLLFLSMSTPLAM